MSHADNLSSQHAEHARKHLIERKRAEAIAAIDTYIDLLIAVREFEQPEWFAGMTPEQIYKELDHAHP